MTAKCRDCRKRMRPGTPCTRKTITIGGKRMKRTPHQLDGNCHDCNAPTGGLHHLGCDMERCPVCAGQLISCGCWGGDRFPYKSCVGTYHPTARQADSGR